jgi:hypothetical protein
MMVNNSTDIIKTNNYLLPQIIEHKKKDHDICQCKSRSLIRTVTQMWVLNQLLGSRRPNPVVIYQSSCHFSSYGFTHLKFYVYQTLGCSLAFLTVTLHTCPGFSELHVVRKHQTNNLFMHTTVVHYMYMYIILKY